MSLSCQGLASPHESLFRQQLARSEQCVPFCGTTSLRATAIIVATPTKTPLLEYADQGRAQAVMCQKSSRLCTNESSKSSARLDSHRCQVEPPKFFFQQLNSSGDGAPPPSATMQTPAWSNTCTARSRPAPSAGRPRPAPRQRRRRQRTPAPRSPRQRQRCRQRRQRHRVTR
jgi:hypothetical protein